VLQVTLEAGAFRERSARPEREPAVRGNEPLADVLARTAEELHESIEVAADLRADPRWDSGRIQRQLRTAAKASKRTASPARG